MTTLVLDHASRVYDAAVPVIALDRASINILQGDFVAIEGPSGAGKSTLLNILALLDVPTTGTYLINGVDTAGMREKELATLRCETFGFVFQSFHLLPHRTALDNVMIGLLYHNVDVAEAMARAQQALEFVGLGERAGVPAGSLSGGERQRVAIARAVCAGNPVLLADEPTGNLDSASSTAIMDILESLNASGTTVVVVTHDPAVAARAGRRVRVVDGRLSETGVATVSSADAKRATAAPFARAESVALPVQEKQTQAARRRSRRLPLVARRAMLRDVLLSLTTEPGRTARLVAVVVLSIMLALSTMGIAQTAKYQVSAAFDATRNRRVAIAVDTGALDSTSSMLALAVTDPEAMTRIRAIPGVQDAMGITTLSEIPAATSAYAPTTDARLFGISTVPDSSTLLEVTATPVGFSQLEDDQVLIGSTAASRLGIGPLEASPTLWVAGRPYEIAGVVTSAGMRPELTDGIVLTQARARDIGEVESTGVEIQVRAGAAGQVARVAAVAWSPEYADAVTTDAPPDPSSLRESIEPSVNTVLLTLTAVATVVGVAVLSNAMTSAVQARTGELALRRAMGARPRNLRRLVSLESLLIGITGGMIGAVGSVVALLIVAITQQWQPVIDLRMLPLGIVLGIANGLLSSLWAAHRAGRIQPAQALR
ncbi:ATP-binding cassette domain-containing protein [Actinomyces qiguomingii]|uniref:ABC transporter ATP-binding protein/permease n=1 Tax=Actinomyces qiguomingii TaxID=2057800 RepID=UPI000CA02801|nr:ATP-binding cassette domain-containing protein [Actinomyces qiguomingii]